MNINKIMKQAQKMQKDLQKTQAEIAQLSVEGTAGGGAVTVTLKGDYSVDNLSIDIDSSQDDIEMLQDMIQAAFNNAVEKVRQESEKRMGAVSGDMPGIPGMF